MIVYVDIDHEKVRNDLEKRDEHFSKLMDLKTKFEKISGVPCLIQHYREVSLAGFQKLGVQAMIISGNSTDWSEYQENAFHGLNQVILAAPIPILGVCGGLQKIGMAHGVKIQPLRRLHSKEDDPCNLLAPGYFKEAGFTPIKVLKDDPIFFGIDGEPKLMALHYEQLEYVPQGFEWLASSQACDIQVIKQIDRPVYGFQLHPEAYCEQPTDNRSALVRKIYPQGFGQVQTDGRMIIENFFRIGGLIK